VKTRREVGPITLDVRCQECGAALEAKLAALGAPAGAEEGKR
jgi:hypothetical protein